MARLQHAISCICMSQLPLSEVESTRLHFDQPAPSSARGDRRHARLTGVGSDANFSALLLLVGVNDSKTLSIYPRPVWASTGELPPFFSLAVFPRLFSFFCFCWIVVRAAVQVLLLFSRFLVCQYFAIYILIITQTKTYTMQLTALLLAASSAALVAAQSTTTSSAAAAGTSSCAAEG